MSTDEYSQTALAKARELAAAGMSVLPIMPGVSKRPAVRWQEYQVEPPRPDEIERWFTPNTDGVVEYGMGVVTGAVSGRLELCEIEGRALDQYPAIRARLQAEHPELWEKLQGWVELSPSGGIHWLYRLTGTVPGNTKLASRPSTNDEFTAWLETERVKAHRMVDEDLKVRRLDKIDRMTEVDVPQVLAETRGEGGFVVVAPTSGKHHETGVGWLPLAGGPEHVLVLTPEERATFHELLRDELDTMPVRTGLRTPDERAWDNRERGSSVQQVERRASSGLFDRVSPLDDYEARHDWSEILLPHGWTLTREDTDGTRYWLRPGSDGDPGRDHSATTGHAGDRDRLFVFSTSTEFDPEVPYTKVGALAVLEYGGDHKRMAEDLAGKGYGSGPTSPLGAAPRSPLAQAVGDMFKVAEQYEALSAPQDDRQAPDDQPVTPAPESPAGTPPAPAQQANSDDGWVGAPTTNEDGLTPAEVEAQWISHKAAEKRLDILAVEHARRMVAAEHGVDGSTWQRVDLTDVLDGEWAPPEPDLMRRTDGRCLLYKGMVHTFQGESESGKSMLAQAVAAEILTDGGRVLYLDFESDRGTVAPRILQLGAPRDDVAARFDYLNPDEDPTSPLSAGYPHWQGILRTEYDLVVIDGVNEALSVFGKSIIDNDDVTAWGRTFPRAIARETGAAVVCIDHVTKSKDGRGRFAIGAQAKLSYLTGASYTVEPEEFLAPGKVGRLLVRVGKDRPGGVRAFAGEYRGEDRSQLAATVTIDSRGEGIRYSCAAAPKQAPAPDPEAVFRPTYLMEKVSREYERAAEERVTLTVRMLRAAVAGKTDAVDQARAVLAAEGYIARSDESKTAPLVFARAYREADDPSSARYQERAEIG